MTKRKEVRGLDVFFQGVTGTKEKEEEVLESVKTEKPISAKTDNLNKVKAEERKERVNYYLDSQLVEALDKAQAEIRSLIKKKITKSDIIAAALEQALRDFWERGRESALVRALKEMYRESEEPLN